MKRFRWPTYQHYLRSPEWKVRRMAALRRAEYRCQLCNSKGPLDVHHRTYERIGRELPTDLTTLCRPCHAKHHGKESEPHQHTPPPIVDEHPPDRWWERWSNMPSATERQRTARNPPPLRVCDLIDYDCPDVQAWGS